MVPASSNVIRAFHGIAGIRDEGMTGKDLGPMLLGVYSAVRGTFSSRCFRRWRWLTARMGGLTPKAAHFNQGTSKWLGLWWPPSYPLHTNKEKANQTKNYSYPLFYCKALII